MSLRLRSDLPDLPQMSGTSDRPHLNESGKICRIIGIFYSCQWVNCSFRILLDHAIGTVIEERRQRL